MGMARTYAANVMWLMSADVFGKILGLIVVVIIARHLGPDQFGLYAYAFSVAGLFGMLGHMGLEAILIRELASRPDAQGETLGTTFLLRFMGYATAALALLVYAFAVHDHLPDEHLLFTIAAAGILVAVLPAVLGAWFKARVEARYPSAASICTMGTAAFLKVAAVFFGAGVVAIAVAQTLGAASGALLLLVFYLRRQGPPFGEWRISWRRSKSLLGESWKILLGTLLALIYMKIDITMVRLHMDPAAAGLYAVPATLVYSLHSVAIAVSTTLFPRMVSHWSADVEAFWRHMRFGLSLLVAAAYAIIVGIALFGPAAMTLFFGEAFAAAGPALVILGLSLPFAFSRYMITRWIIMDGRGNYLLWSEGLGACVNVALNLLLIPVYGLVGAALATVAAYCVASVLSLALMPSGARMLRTLVASLLNPMAPLVSYLRVRA